ncbi:MAG TPA: bacillithiol biosynthesis deacetylase BshB1 [Candidatus Krumholzibacteria bacterium]|nr:bacillithiol biosynthesis deacetylase BshB1 [Candidatus Krumholzibacteria bacterium]
MNAARREAEVDALFLSPHPDDVELFCGGTVARLVEAGCEVAIVDLTRGEMSSNGTVEERREASLRAAEILGVKREREVLGLPDGGVNEHDGEQLRALVELLRALRPRLLFAPHGVDRHPDHAAAGSLARRAMFFAGVRRFEARGKVHRPRLLAAYPCHTLVPVSFTLDVGSVMEARRAAIAAYHSQFQAGPDSTATYINRPGFLEAREARLREWGLASGVEFAEGFVLDEALPLSDPRALLLPEDAR